ncbi:MAG TPA: DNA recombination protein RmuC [Candidatus Saccharimonadales bacterium]|nr:DNA recombination protein RmuC [Candidatus Saccharimonadales bacterium]
MEMLLVVVIIILLAGFGLVVYLLNQKMAELKNDSGIGLLKQDLVGMNAQITGTTKEINDRLNQAASYMMGVQTELGKMAEIGRSMKDLQDFLRSPKLRGNVGEQVLRDLLEQMIPKRNFSLQYGFKSGEKVDAIVKTKNGLIPIDAKFPMENFSRGMAADNEDDKARFMHEFSKDVRKHLTSIARKYIVPGEGTVDFALMYVPSESIYYEIICNTDLQNSGIEQKVYMVSPNTFYYFLQTIMLALEGEKVEEKAKLVLQALKGIQQDARKFGAELELVGGHLTRAKNAMEGASASYGRLSNKIETTGQLQSGAVELMAELAPASPARKGAAGQASMLRRTAGDELGSGSGGDDGKVAVTSEVS